MVLRIIISLAIAFLSAAILGGTDVLPWVWAWPAGLTIGAAVYIFASGRIARKV